MRDVLVLCYHALSDRWPADLSTAPDRFEAQLELLLGRGYRPVTFEQAVAEPAGARILAVTFDDAYRSVLERARPIMDRLGVPGTVFVPTDWAGRPEPMAWDGIDQWLGGPHEQELLCLGWEELRELADTGWEVGSHTRSHPRLTTLDDDGLSRELEESRAACQDGVGRPCRSIAYPYGDVDARVIAATRAAGYYLGASLPKRLGSTSRLDWPRVGVYHRDGLGRFKLKVSPLLRRVRGSAAWGALASARDSRRHRGRA
jgi:peptidoglycan/xylan/chitin deacetylase (PgdA/CDA1 family)